MKVSVFVGSITDPELGAHAIVNASNPEVALGSGVSGAIREACGGVGYQREVSEAKEDEFGEPLEPDDCLVTSAGTAKHFRWVLHVPAVNYRRPDPETGGPSGPSRIRACTRVALVEANRLATENGLDGQLVLGVVLLGAGHGGVGEVASLDAMMEVVADSSAVSAIGEIRFAVLDERIARLVPLAAAKHGAPVRV